MPILKVGTDCSRFRCSCGEMWVDVRQNDGTLRPGCPSCELLEVVDVVRQIYRVRS